MAKPDTLRRHALQIWQAGVEAVRADRLTHAAMQLDGDLLRIGNQEVALRAVRRIAVVGAGKAAGKMAAAVEEILGPRLMAEKQLIGWVNVPADCAAGLARIHLHPARPPGVNEPTPQAAAGAAEILRIVEALGPDDLCICLIAGGGSALLPAPAEGITLEDKLAVTRFLSAAGANIQQLNTVRKQLSRIKGGGLARACRAGTLVSLIISDVPGDPLDVIASGPTVPDGSTPAAALEILRQFGAEQAGVPRRVLDYLSAKAAQAETSARSDESATAAPSDASTTAACTDSSSCGARAEPPEGIQRRVVNLVIGNNATAVAAAAEEARRLGYTVESSSATSCEGLAEQLGAALAEKALRMRATVAAASRKELHKEGLRDEMHNGALREAVHKWPETTASGSALPAGQSVTEPGASCQPVVSTCYISGGEPVVKLVDVSRRGLGGRNQQLVLAAAQYLWHRDCEALALLSGGTDGEDGPTDAAGAVLDAAVLAAARQRQLDPADYLARNDAYHFFDPLGALIRTGPTHTNVCDLRVVVVAARQG